jgi:hypothetical protein
MLQCFPFLWFLEYFLARFLILWCEEFFFDSFHGFECYDKPHHLPLILEWIYDSSPFDLTNFSRFHQNLGSSSSSKIEREIFGLKKYIWELVPCVEVTLMSKFHPIWCLVAQESKLRRKFLGGSDISGNFTRYIHRDRIYSVQYLMTVLAIFY